MLPRAHKRYLAVTPLNFARNGIAPQYEAENDPGNAAFWAAQPLDSNFVKQAYYNHIERLIGTFQPDYLAYAVEANILINTSPDKWAQFVELMRFVYVRVKQNHPDLPLMITLQAESFYEGFGRFPSNPWLHYFAMSQVFPFTDYLAVSSYPYMKYMKPELLPADYFSVFGDLAPQKPFVIAETGWPAEPLEPPYNVPANMQDQQRYLSRVLAEVQSANGVFVNLLLPRDYDALWESVFKNEADAFLLRLWRDMGLYDGAGNARPSLQIWKRTLSLPRVNPLNH